MIACTVCFFFNFDVIKHLIQSGARAREAHQSGTMGSNIVSTPSNRANLLLTSSCSESKRVSVRTDIVGWKRKSHHDGLTRKKKNNVFIVFCLEILRDEKRYFISILTNSLFSVFTGIKLMLTPICCKRLFVVARRIRRVIYKNCKNALARYLQ